MIPQEEREALKALAASPGWKLLDEAMRRAETRIAQNIVATLPPEEVPAARRELRGIHLWRDTLTALMHGHVVDVHAPPQNLQQ